MYDKNSGIETLQDVTVKDVDNILNSINDIFDKAHDNHLSRVENKMYESMLDADYKKDNIFEVKGATTPHEIVDYAKFMGQDSVRTAEIDGKIFIAVDKNHSSDAETMVNNIYNHDDSSIIGDKSKNALVHELVNQGITVDTLINHQDAEVRAAAARMGFGTEQLANDEDYRVRAAVASTGYNLDRYADDDNAYVRREVAKQGYALDKLSQDSDYKVQEAALKQGYNLNAARDNSADSALLNDTANYIKDRFADGESAKQYLEREQKIQDRAKDRTCASDVRTLLNAAGASQEKIDTISNAAIDERQAKRQQDVKKRAEEYSNPDKAKERINAAHAAMAQKRDSQSLNKVGSGAALVGALSEKDIQKMIAENKTSDGRLHQNIEYGLEIKERRLRKHYIRDKLEGTGDRATSGYRKSVKDSSYYDAAKRNAGITAQGRASGRAAAEKRAMNRLYASLQRQERRVGKNATTTLQEFLKINGKEKEYLGFNNKKDAKATMNAFNQVLIEKKLIHYNPKTKSFNYDKLLKMNDDDLKRALGIVNAGNTELKQLKDSIALNAASQNHRAAKNQARKDLTRQTAHYLLGNSVFMAGWRNLMQPKEQALKIYRTTKEALRLVKNLTKGVVRGIATTRFLPGGKERKARLEQREILKRQRKEKRQERKFERIQAIKDKLTLKKQREKLRETSKRAKEAAKERFRRALGATAFGRKLLSISARFKNSWITKGLGKTFGAVKGLASLLNRLNPFALLDIAKQWIKRKLMIFAGAGLLILVVVGSIPVVVTSVTSLITGFFSWIDVDGWFSSNDPMDSQMGRVYTRLMKKEDDWLENLTDTDRSSTIFHKLKYGKENLSPADYVNQYHIKGLTGGTGTSFYANPWGFAVDNSAIVELNSFDGGNTVYLETVGLPNTSNSKQILCMAATYFENDDMVQGTATSNSTTDSNFQDSSKVNSSDPYWGFDNESTKIMKNYTDDLFNKSHKEILDVEYLIYPTVWTDAHNYAYDYDGIFDKAANVYSSELPTNPDKTGFMCTEYDAGGCQTSSIFSYVRNESGVPIFGLYDTNGNFVDIGNRVMPTDGATCYLPQAFTDTNLKTAYINSPDCFDITISTYNYSDSTGAEPYMYTEWKKSDTEPTLTELTAANNIAAFFAEKKDIKDLISDYQNPSVDYIHGIYVFHMYSAKIESEKRKEAGREYTVVGTHYYDGDTEVFEETKKIHGTNVTGFFKANGTELYSDAECANFRVTFDYDWVETDEKEVVYYREKRTPVNIIVKHKCMGNHEGHYCGGHLKLNITGIIYNFTELQTSETDSEVIGKVKPGERVKMPGSLLSTTLVDKNMLAAAEDLFDIDEAMTHTAQQKSWEGWTEDNMQLALLKYNMDFEDTYGFDISESIALKGKPCYNPFDFDWTPYITCQPGYRINPAGVNKGKIQYHNGMDIANHNQPPLQEGITPVKCIQDGLVLKAEFNSARGNFVLIQDENGYKYYYQHFSSIAPGIAVGDMITHGTVVGILGTTGASTGPHFHIGIEDPSGTIINPALCMSSAVEGATTTSSEETSE